VTGRRRFGVGIVTYIIVDRIVPDKDGKRNAEKGPVAGREGPA